MNKLFSSDKPVSLADEDQFQRYGFSKGIANIITGREEEACIVIGVYGAWGEGKTSVINFIETELNRENNIITIKFNPWRYNDENLLLIHFFQTLANALDTNLKNKKEKIGDQLKKYAKLLTFDVPVFGNVGEKLEAAGEMLAGVDIETLKERIEELLKKAKRKIVIFIDDIDRLDKTEIHSIFRLVKLTADFANTTYVLSFDDEMVSAALGDRFGEGNQNSGQNFLEKIIQIPLKIPVAQPAALQKFCFDIINRSLETNKIDLPDDEGRSIGNEFSQNILIMLSTPRLAVRYGNTLSFSLPLLHKEVNMVDLMLIEAIKIFYPKYYQLVKSNPEYFIGSYSNGYSHERNSEKIKLFNELLETTGADLSKKQRQCIKNLLQRLFPVIREALQNYSYSRDSANDWFKQQRIASAKYFNRYFSYAVIEGEISDIAFNNFISEIPNQTDSEISKSVKGLIQQSSPETFLLKIRSREEELSWEVSVKLSRIIATESELFPKPTGFSFRFASPNGQAVFFIIQLIKKHPNKKEQLQLIEKLINEANPFEFASELFYELKRKDKNEEKEFFSVKEYQTIVAHLIARALKESVNSSIFEKFPDQTAYLFNEWGAKNKSQLTKYVKTILQKDYSKSLDLLRAFTPTIFSTAYENPFKSNFAKEDYTFFIALFDKNYIKKLLSKVFPDKKLNKEKVKWSDRGDNNQTDINMVRQFMHWFNEEEITLTT